MRKWYSTLDALTAVRMRKWYSTLDALTAVRTKLLKQKQQKILLVSLKEKDIVILGYDCSDCDARITSINDTDIVSVEPL